MRKPLVCIFAYLLLCSLSSSAQCRSSLWSLIYHPSRLQVLDSCVTVAGTIEKIVKEKDGDLHISLRLDSQYNAMLAPGNIAHQHGCLVVEIVPGSLSSADGGRRWNGKHIICSGSYVFDIHHGWNEIHPVSSITEIY